MIKFCLFCQKEFKTRSTKRKYCCHKCYSDSQIGIPLNLDIKGSKNPNWKGGRRKDKDGYILIHAPFHPYCDSDGYVREHRLVMEKYFKKFLLPQEVVHHKNNNKEDNRIENLELFKKEEHDRQSAFERMATGFRLPKRKVINEQLCFITK